MLCCFKKNIYIYIYIKVQFDSYLDYYIGLNALLVQYVFFNMAARIILFGLIVLVIIFGVPF